MWHNHHFLNVHIPVCEIGWVNTGELGYALPPCVVCGCVTTCSDFFETQTHSHPVDQWWSDDVNGKALLGLKLRTYHQVRGDFVLTRDMSLVSGKQQTNVGLLLNYRKWRKSWWTSVWRLGSCLSLSLLVVNLQTTVFFLTPRGVKV